MGDLYKSDLRISTAGKNIGIFKIKAFKPWKTTICFTWLIAFKSTVVNRELPFFNRGSLEITLTVPLMLNLVLVKQTSLNLHF